MKPNKKNEWSPEPFPEVRTFPSGWDGSALTSTRAHQDSAEGTGSQTKTSDSQEWTPEKFPKPRTFPKNWSIDD